MQAISQELSQIYNISVLMAKIYEKKYETEKLAATRFADFDKRKHRYYEYYKFFSGIFRDFDKIFFHFLNLHKMEHIHDAAFRTGTVPNMISYKGKNMSGYIYYTNQDNLYPNTEEVYEEDIVLMYHNIVEYTHSNIRFATNYHPANVARMMLKFLDLHKCNETTRMYINLYRDLVEIKGNDIIIDKIATRISNYICRYEPIVYITILHNLVCELRL